MLKLQQGYKYKGTNTRLARVRLSTRVRLSNRVRVTLRAGVRVTKDHD